MPRVIDLIRHGQSTFNAHWELTGTDPLHFDARLSEIGHDQVTERRRTLAGEHYDLIVTSPLTRAIQTALGVFASHLDDTPVIVEALHRERVESSCDVGRVPPELQADFPMLDFDHLPHQWWPNGGDLDALGVPVESEASCLLRVAAFRDWLASRPEERVAVIGHGTFFYHLSGKSLANCELHRLSL